MICDYFFIRKNRARRQLAHHTEGAYYYTKGINPRAVVALVLGVGIALIGLGVESLHSCTITRGSWASSWRAASTES